MFGKERSYDFFIVPMRNARRSLKPIEGRKKQYPAFFSLSFPLYSSIHLRYFAVPTHNNEAFQVRSINHHVQIEKFTKIGIDRFGSSNARLNDD